MGWVSSNCSFQQAQFSLLIKTSVASCIQIAEGDIVIYIYVLISRPGNDVICTYGNVVICTPGNEVIMVCTSGNDVIIICR